MRVIFVRHGRSEGNQYGLVQGHLDLNLTDEGRTQVVQAAREIKKLIGRKRPLVFSSDLSRAWETAVIITEELKLPPPIPDQRLRERDMGELQDRHWTTVDWENVNSDTPTIASLESKENFIRRIHDFLLHIIGQEEIVSDTAIVVTHGGTLAFIYHLLLSIGLNNVPKLSNATIHVFHVTMKHRRLNAIKE